MWPTQIHTKSCFGSAKAYEGFRTHFPITCKRLTQSWAKVLRVLSSWERPLSISPLAITTGDDLEIQTLLFSLSCVSWAYLW
jgi:hypothetical protein